MTFCSKMFQFSLLWLKRQGHKLLDHCYI